MAFGRFTQWIGDTVGSVFENEDENNKVPEDVAQNVNNHDNRIDDKNPNRTTSDEGASNQDSGPGLWSQLMQILPDFSKSDEVTRNPDIRVEDVSTCNKTINDKHINGKIRIEYDEYLDSATEASDSGTYTSDGKSMVYIPMITEEMCICL